MDRRSEQQSINAFIHLSAPGSARRNLAPAAEFAQAELEIAGGSGIFPIMPIYEFHCEKCKRDSEILVRSSNWEGTACPHCGSMRLSKKLSVFASSVAGASPGSACESGNGGGGCGCCCGGGPHHH